MGRCGSTILASLLASHQQIHWGGEIFNTNNKRGANVSSEQFVINTIRESRNKFRAPIHGFETKYLSSQHLSQPFINMDLEAYVSLLRSLKISNFIILHRKNYLRRLISQRVGGIKKTWHTKQQVDTPTEIRIDVDAVGVWGHKGPLLDIFRWMDENHQHLQTILANDNTLSLCYEDDILPDPKIAYGKVCSFLNLSPENPAIKLQRTNPFAIKDMIENYEEVQAALRNSPYEWMLE